MKKKKEIGTLGIVVLAAVIAAVLLFGKTMDDIEDVNGPDNHTLATITEADIIAREMSCSTVPGTAHSKLSFGNITLESAIEFYSDKFSGLYELDNYYIFKGSDIYFDIWNFEVTEGNCQIFVVLEDTIIGVLNEGQEVTFHQNVTESGNVRVVLAGESAAFSFESTYFEDPNGDIVE